MLNCIVIDDEPLAQDLLAGYLGQEGTTRLVARFNNAYTAQAFLQHHKIDVIFLDIEMPEMNGIELLRSLPNPPITIFTTAFRDYAFEGFELGVIDFLLKPISFARFQLAISRVKDFLALQSEETSLDKEKTDPGFIFVKSGVTRIKLSFSDVTHIQGLKDYAIIHTTTGKIVIKGSVKSVHQLFPAEQFIRTHKSFIVATDKVKRIEKNKILIGIHEIPIGRSYKTDVEQRITRLPRR